MHISRRDAAVALKAAADRALQCEAAQANVKHAQALDEKATEDSEDKKLKTAEGAWPCNDKSKAYFDTNLKTLTSK